MTELDWQMTGTRPQAMLDLVRKRLGARRLRLLACGFCRVASDALTPEWRDNLTTAERFAEGGVVEPDFTALHVRELRALFSTVGKDPLRVAVFNTLHPEAALGLNTTYDWLQQHFGHGRSGAEWRASACELIREIAGNPFRPWVRNPDFLGGGLTAPDGRTVPFTADARHLARSIALAQEFDRLPILADAAEEMGLNDAELLEHLRRPGGHVRGCWALDLLDGKG